MIIRLAKVILVASISVFCFLVAFSNASDTGSNYPLIEQALAMVDTFPNSMLKYRAISNPALHHVAFFTIISLEALTAIFCAIGAWKLFWARNEKAKEFNDSKSWAIAGLTLGFLTWYILFIAIGGEWFTMWMYTLGSQVIATSYHIVLTILGVLIFTALKDD